MHKISTYQQLDQYVNAFADGHLGLLWLVGPPGVQKSRGLRSALARRSSCWINGSVTAFGLYRELYTHHRTPLTVIDDVDDLFRMRDAINLLKCLCQTEDFKVLGWHTDNQTLRREEIPRSFSTKTKVCVISNEIEVTNPNVEALQDRGHLVTFEPSAREVHARTREWFWDSQIYSFIGARLAWIEQASMRHYVLSAEKKAGGLDWRTWLFSQWGLEGKRLLVAQLQANEHLTQADRVRIYCEHTDEDEISYQEQAYDLGYRRSA